MISKCYKIGLLISLFFLCSSAIAQISHGGEPLFSTSHVKASINFEQLPEFSEVEVKSTAVLGYNIQRVKKEKYAHIFDVDYSSETDGIWTNLEDGRRVWHFSLESKSAYSLGLVFRKFKLPEDGQLFIYNDIDDRFLGAFTSKNNKDFEKLAVEPLKGDHLMIEYIGPEHPEFDAEIEIGKVIHDYKNIFNMLKMSTKSISGFCNVNINCSEGSDFQLEKRSVCHILSRGYISSGALMNNTNKDGKPYLLTAYHAFSQEADAEEAIFYFNYEDTECESNDGVKTNSLSGSVLLANTNRLDFALVELSSQPPMSYSPYYAGWDRSGAVPTHTVCIHHPSGDAKKISIDYDAPTIATYSDSDYEFDANTHWKIADWEIGTTEGGSSGSPLFDQNHRVIGDLTGGTASCSNSVNDYYARFSDSWDTFPEANRQLKAWLDPSNSGVQTLDGFDPAYQINASSKCINSNFEVQAIQKESMENPYWTFGEDAVPSTAEGVGPHTFYYTSAGEKTIVFTYQENGQTVRIENQVRALDFAELNFAYTVKGNEIKFTNSSVFADSYSWNFGDDSTSIEINPVHTYSSKGVYTVTLTGTNDCGDNSMSKEIISLYDRNLKIYPNPSRGEFTVDLGNVLFDKVYWSVFSLRGSKVKEGIISSFSDQLTFNLDGNASGIYILTLDIDGEELQYKLVLID